MITIADIRTRLLSLKFSDSVVDRYFEPHRYYHTATHLMKVIDNLGADAEDDLFLAAAYHDAVYDPRSNDNEKNSAELFATEAKKAGLSDDLIKNISRYILDTKTHEPSDSKSSILMKADLYILDVSLSEQIEHEHQIFREYQYLDYNTYQKKRVQVLLPLNKNGKLDALIEYVKARKPLIGVFCGSFSPFHKGHYNILQKAERIFDKVIIAFGKNPEKEPREWKRPVSINNRQTEEYSGLLTDFVASLSHDVVVIRGLRNSTDFQYEQNQYRYIQELMPEIKIVNIFCDKEFEHISSSGIRTLEKFEKHHKYLLE